MSVSQYSVKVQVPDIPSTRPDDEFTRTQAHHAPNGGFTNPWPSRPPLHLWAVLKDQLARRFPGGVGNAPDRTHPSVTRTPVQFLPTREMTTDGKVRATWLGHSCYYVEFATGLRVLFDPVFEARCSPFTWLGPKRYNDAPCAVKDIPFVDAVAVSHNHYDHLSYPTILEIAKRFPNCHFFAPLGLKKWFTNSGISSCTELDWWDEVDFTLTPISGDTGGSGTISARFSCLPCQHFSSRSLTDRGAALWASWGVSSGPNTSVYFAGDTGYRAVPRAADGREYDDWAPELSTGPDALPVCPAFKDIGRLRGPFTVGLIPIGAYQPRWIMSPIHANPRDAVEIFRDTKCERALAMHWGTWVLTEEDVFEPPTKLKEALMFHNIPKEGVFDPMSLGGSKVF